MHKQFLIIIGLFFSLQLGAADSSPQRVYLKTCKTHGTKQDVRIFTRCMRVNVVTVDDVLKNVNLKICPSAYSMRQEIENCHNVNFSMLNYELRLKLEQCHNFGSDVSVSYQYCINRNFQKIENSLNELNLKY